MYIYIYIYIYLIGYALLPPAPFLGSGTLMTGDRWLVTAGL